MRLILFMIICVLAHGKVCPKTIPIPIGEAFSILCNTTLNPTGQTLDDPPCYYDECINQKSAVCGCVDFSLFGSSGMFWGCIHSKCDCVNSLEHSACDIHGSDFQDSDFIGNPPVTGIGCTLNNRTGCLCKPVIGDGVQIDDWTWQCSENIYQKDLSDLAIGFIAFGSIILVISIFSAIIFKIKFVSDDKML